MLSASASSTPVPAAHLHVVEPAAFQSEQPQFLLAPRLVVLVWNFANGTKRVDNLPEWSGERRIEAQRGGCTTLPALHLPLTNAYLRTVVKAAAQSGTVLRLCLRTARGRGRTKEGAAAPAGS